MIRFYLETKCCVYIYIYLFVHEIIHVEYIYTGSLNPENKTEMRKKCFMPFSWCYCAMWKKIEEYFIGCRLKYDNIHLVDWIVRHISQNHFCGLVCVLFRFYFSKMILSFILAIFFSEQ